MEWKGVGLQPFFASTYSDLAHQCDSFREIMEEFGLARDASSSCIFGHPWLPWSLITFY